MKTPMLALVFFATWAAAHAVSITPAAVAPGSLQCNGLANPVGVDTPTPMLSWLLTARDSSARGDKQTAYEVVVASSERLLDRDQADLWDSGKVASDQSINVAYAGTGLKTWQAAYWKVRVWDQNGRPSAWSDTAHWTMALLAADDWHAKWIGHDLPAPTANNATPARWLRKEFTVGKTIRRALVSFAGLGTSELYVNGFKAGDAVLSPALSDYDKRVYYVTYDVTTLLKPGANALGVVLGNGRYYAPRVTGRNGLLSFGWPKLILQLRLEYADGTSEDIVSDESWKYSEDGPIRANNEYDGEDYDARQEMSGWAKPGFDDKAWANAAVVSAPGGVLCAQDIEPIRVTGTIQPVSVKEISPGVFVYDFGQNFVGWCRLEVNGPAGATVTMKFAERLHDDGTISQENLRTAKATDHYILKGGGPEAWQPRFTYHGFRYVEVTGYPGKPTLGSLEGRVVNDDLASAGDFASSNDLLNKIYQCVAWGVRGNYRSMPTDCPQRDERQGWLGDRAAESRGEMYVFNNQLLYDKWLQDIVDAQRDDGSVPAVAPHYWSVYNDDVTWPSALLLIPESLRLEYGDTAAVTRNYPAMVKWVDHMTGYVTPDGLQPRDKYGDWCMPPETPTVIHSTDPARLTAGPLLGTAYFYHDLGVMGQFAALAGKPDDEKRFAALATKLDFGFNAKYLNRQLGHYDNDTQTANAVPLAFGLVPDDEKAPVFASLVNSITNIYHNHIGTGLIGAAWLNRVLTDNGRADLAYAIATNRDYPGWGYMVEHGATTIWELWNGDTADVQMNSGNHVMLVGDLVIWLYEDLAGIAPDPAQPGFKNILMKPVEAGDLSFVKASHRSLYGLIESEWHRDATGFRWHIAVPPNSTATVFVPANSADSVREGGRKTEGRPGVKFLRFENGRAVYQLDAGTYEFQVAKS
ncbi:MAG TPA: family 78 glycoside hydrolase catalytic domain [Opitutales bacterium]|nr:family 78 glycoside hydrolase catalytic domain [Opitutales bacterium]